MQTRGDFLEYLHGNLRLARTELLCRRREKIIRLVNGQRGELRDVLPANRDGKRLGLQTCAPARRTRGIRHVVLVALAHLLGVRLAVAARERGQDPLERDVVLLLLAEHVDIAKGDIFVGRAVQQKMLRLFVHAVPLRVNVVVMRVEERRDRAHTVGVRVL